VAIRASRHLDGLDKVQLPLGSAQRCYVDNGSLVHIAR
jgi:hypothetical protein